MFEHDSTVIGLSYLNLFILLVGLILPFFSKGGHRYHLGYTFYLVVSLLYRYATPLYMYNTGVHDIILSDISAYFDDGFAMFSLAHFCFIIGYWVIGAAYNDKRKYCYVQKVSEVKLKRIVFLLYCFFTGIVMLNLAMGGVNWVKVATGTQAVGMGRQGASYYFQNFVNSLISILILSRYVKQSKLIFYGQVLFTFLLFMLLGFRFRIILTLFGFFFVYIIVKGLKVGTFFSLLMLGLVFFYGIFFITHNRNAFKYNKSELVEFNAVEFDYQLFFVQSRGALPDMAVMRHFDIPARLAQHDYGTTMFVIPFVRMTPRAILKNKDDFYPPPQLQTTIDSYDAYYAEFTGEATLDTGAWYIAYGWYGIVFGMLLLGYLLRRLVKRTDYSSKLSVGIYVCISVLIFQWLTRGYFPQFLDNLAYMYFPFILIRKLAFKKVLKDEVEGVV